MNTQTTESPGNPGRFNPAPAENPGRFIVINADDLGMSPEVNSAIFAAFDLKLISSATLLTNMNGFDDATLNLHNKLLAGRIGVHLNLVEGRPLTRAIARLPRFCNADGKFRGVRPKAFYLSRTEAAAVEDEIRAQIEAVGSRGIVPSHIDSHHHAHTEWGIGRVVSGVALEMSVPAVRLTRNCGAGISLEKRVYKAIFNRRLKRLNLALTSTLGAASDVLPVPLRGPGPIEIEVHPQFARGMLVDATGNDHRSLADVVSPLARLFTSISYADLARLRRARMHGLTRFAGV